LVVKFSELQQYGVEKPFFLENHNIDSSQKNIVFMVRGESAKKIRMVAGMSDEFCLYRKASVGDTFLGLNSDMGS
jgi:hypothetical protein